ncbi:MAG: hypothetical protein U0736_24530 [Gemmataceae bacterium]
MTECDWLTCADPRVMLHHLRDHRAASDRQLRLFACACCRAVWDSLIYGAGQRAVETAERYADGMATRDDLHRARSRAGAAVSTEVCISIRRRLVRPLDLRLRLAMEAVHDHQPFLVGRLGAIYVDMELRTAAPDLLRDVVGNPFRPSPPLAPEVRAWNGGLVVPLAQAAYDERQLPAGHLDPVRLAVLADALEEAGCADGELLCHLRSIGPHVRGCWAVDVILGRS